MRSPPTEEEILEGMSRLKGNRAGEKNNILPEMLKSCGPHILDKLCDLFATVWREGRVLSEWRDAVLVPILKKRREVLYKDGQHHQIIA